MQHLFTKLGLILLIVILYSCKLDIEDCKTKEDYEKYIVQNPANNNSYRVFLLLSYQYIDNKEFDSAVIFLNKYKMLFEDYANIIEKKIEILSSKTENIEIQKVPNVNVTFNYKTAIKALSKSESEINKITLEKYLMYVDRNPDKDTTTLYYSHAFPIVSLDGSKMYICADNRPDGYGGEDVYVSEFTNGIWSKSKNFSDLINTYHNEGVVSISADGNTIVLFGSYDDLGLGDLYYIEKTEEGWSEIKHFPEPINSIYVDFDGSFTQDGKAFIFVSDRPSEKNNENYEYESDNSNTDIFITFKTNDGWSEPIKLGDSINTMGNERTPFLHPDGKTLYFSSDGHVGLGSYDVFKSVRLSDTSWTEWSKPINLGKYINSTKRDWNYRIPVVGDKIYFSKMENSGVFQIYSIKIPEIAKPAVEVATISGKITDEKGNGVSARIRWDDLESGKNMGELRSDPQTGDYFIALPIGKLYGYYAELEGYYPISKSLDLRKVKSLKEIKDEPINITIISKKVIEEGATVVVNNIFFDYNKSELKTESYTELDRLTKLFKDNSSWKVEIGGHTDAIGGAAYNLPLSQSRAESVVNYLVSKGISSDRIIAKGYGAEKPIETNATEDGRAKNRRVEFRIIK